MTGKKGECDQTKQYKNGASGTDKYLRLGSWKHEDLG
jgi:hypothetical protein